MCERHALHDHDDAKCQMHHSHLQKPETCNKGFLPAIDKVILGLTHNSPKLRVSFFHFSGFHIAGFSCHLLWVQNYIVGFLHQKPAIGLH
jgi:hypothetical protein